MGICAPRASQGRELAVINSVGEAAYRVWRLYMAGSAYDFDEGSTNVYHRYWLATRVNPWQRRCGAMTFMNEAERKMDQESRLIMRFLL